LRVGLAERNQVDDDFRRKRRERPDGFLEPRPVAMNVTDRSRKTHVPSSSMENRDFVLGLEQVRSEMSPDESGAT
jgi:hypothetical protein